MINIPNVLNDYAKTTELDNYVQTDELTNTLSDFVTTDELTDDLKDYVTQTQNVANKKLELDLIASETLDQDEELYWYEFKKSYRQVLCELQLVNLPVGTKGTNITLINNLTQHEGTGIVSVDEERTDLGFYNLSENGTSTTYIYEQNIFNINQDYKPYKYELLLTSSNYQSWHNWAGSVVSPGSCVKKLNGELGEFKGIGFRFHERTEPEVTREKLPAGTTIKIWAK